MKYPVWFLIFCSVQLQAIELGFNIAWWKGDYSHQWLAANYDEAEVTRQFNLVNRAGTSRVRLWLFEGQSLDNFNLDVNGQPISVKAEVLYNLRTTLLLAKKNSIKVNLTLIDANAFCENKNPSGAQREARNFWYNVINNKFQARQIFFNTIITQVLDIVAEENFKNVVDQFELANEINALNSCGMAERKWEALNNLQCGFKQAAHRVANIATTSSVGWGGAESFIIQKKLDLSCVDYVDVHVYNDYGIIANCVDFMVLAKSKILQLGEFGQLSEHTDDALQVSSTQKFIFNANKCGFKSALAWRLDDNQIGLTKFGRFSFMRNGKPRPAFYEMKEK